MDDDGVESEPAPSGRPFRSGGSDGGTEVGHDDERADRRSLAGVPIRGSAWIRLVFLAWAVALPLVYLDQPLHFDEGIFLAVGRRMAVGETLYVDVADHKPPGIYLLSRGIYELTGSPIVAARLLTYGVTAVSGLLVVRLAGAFRARRVAYASGALFVVISYLPHFDGFHFMTEQYAVLALLTAAVLLGGDALRSHLGAGVALGVGVLFNQTVVLFGAVILIVTLLRLRRPDRRTASVLRRSVLEVVAIGTGFLAVLAVAIAALAAQGRLADAVYYTVLLPTTNYSTPFDAWGHALAGAFLLPVWLLAAGVVGRTGVGVVRGEDVTERRLLVVVWAVVLSVPGAIGFAGDHKFLFAFPALSVLAVVGGAELFAKAGGVRRLGRALRDGRPDRSTLAVGLLVAVVLSTAAVAGAGNAYVTTQIVQQDVDDDRAALAAAVDGLEGPVYAYNVQAQVYVHTDVEPATTFLGTIYADDIARGKVADLERNEVRYVLVETGFVADGRVVPARYWTEHKSIMAAYLNDNYEPVRTTDEWVVYERTDRDAGGETPAGDADGERPARQ